MQAAGQRLGQASPRRASGPHSAISCSAWAAATSISACSALADAGQRRRPRARPPARRRPPPAAGSRRAAGSPGRRRRGPARRACRRSWQTIRARAERAGGLVGGQRLLGVARVARAQHGRVRRRPRRAARSRGRATIGREARSPSAARASAPPIAEPPMPATTRPPGESWGARLADSTRHSASRRCSGRPRMSAELAGRVDRGDRLARGRARGRRSKRDRSVGQLARPGRYARRRPGCCPTRARRPRRAPRRPRSGSARRSSTPAADDRAADPACRRRRRRRRAAPRLSTWAPSPIVHAAPEHGAAADDRAARRSRSPAPTQRRRDDPARRPSAPSTQHARRPAATLRPTSVLDVALEDVVGAPAGSARACRCPASSRSPRSRTGPWPTSVGNTSRSIEMFVPGRAPSRRAPRARGCRRRR